MQKVKTALKELKDVLEKMENDLVYGKEQSNFTWRNAIQVLDKKLKSYGKWLQSYENSFDHDFFLFILIHKKKIRNYKLLATVKPRTRIHSLCTGSLLTKSRVNGFWYMAFCHSKKRMEKQDFQADG